MSAPSDACISAFERQYDTTWADPALRNERLAWVASWKAASACQGCAVQQGTHKPADAVHQIAEPAPALDVFNGESQMRRTFEIEHGQSWSDPNWSREAGIWASAWHKATARAVAAAPTLEVSQAARDVLAERLRQVAMGYDAAHDDAHCCEEIAAAAAVFIMPEECRDWDASSTTYGDTLAEALLPCDWGAPEFGHDRRAQLVKGAAMAIAEIERLDRTAAYCQTKTAEAKETARNGGCGCCANACADRADGCRFVHESPSAADMDAAQAKQEGQANG